MNFTTGQSALLQRALIRALALTGVAVLASACLGPTYGTDKTASEQLMDDLGNATKIVPPKGAEINYAPRPEIVRPPNAANLPAPEQNLAKNNPNWVEAPEDTRKRLIAEADENSDKIGYRSPLAKVSVDDASKLTPEQQRQRYLQNRKIQQGAYQGRRYLSDPPVEYKEPAATAPVGELGEPERDKEKRRIAEATKPGQNKWKLPKIWPW